MLPHGMSEIRCAICARPIERRPANRWYPFCSDRCRLLDLGKWLAEDYRIPVKPDEEDEAQPSPEGREDEDLH